ncbi:unnamed protein product [Rotaria magnacalcarata]|uniref:Uncharacterized protein n=1 Tax=Rotaria magnacalcarata TaxID=392030 RepID=A0A816H4J5_9BILA|nr:unnamed protein product [Rotaria magnacalcarata]CAF4092078.1 unnamed protein product [Rotaria magnacalcarata]CAF4901224.1 unnamed protein product [Rotaria magnacalcarata]CAF5059523.1 unnamed protein product [Rotaria magnacalcarata]
MVLSHSETKLSSYLRNAFFIHLEKIHSIWTSSLVLWNYDTNINKENERAQTRQTLLELPFNRKVIPIAKKFNAHLKDSKFDRLALKAVNHNDNDSKEISDLLSKLEDIYSTTKVCELNNSKKCYALDPYLIRFM